VCAIGQGLLGDALVSGTIAHQAGVIDRHIDAPEGHPRRRVNNRSDIGVRFGPLYAKRFRPDKLVIYFHPSSHQESP
jgi:hypothetical protein